MRQKNLGQGRNSRTAKLWVTWEAYLGTVFRFEVGTKLIINIVRGKHINKITNFEGSKDRVGILFQRCSLLPWSPSLLRPRMENRRASRFLLTSWWLKSKHCATVSVSFKPLSNLFGWSVFRPFHRDCWKAYYPEPWWEGIGRWKVSGRLQHQRQRLVTVSVSSLGYGEFVS